MMRTSIMIDEETLNLVKQNKLWYEKSQGETIKRALKEYSCKACTWTLCPKHARKSESKKKKQGPPSQ